MLVQPGRLGLTARRGGGGGPIYLPSGLSSPYVEVVGVKRMVAGYSGPLLRLRETGANAEQDFGIGANDALDLSAYATFRGANRTALVTAYDQSGNAYDNTQATAASQPLFDPQNTLEAIPAMSFGVDDDPTGTVVTRPLAKSSSLSLNRRALTTFIVWAPFGGTANSYGIMGLGTSGTATANLSLLYDTTNSNAPAYLLGDGFYAGGGSPGVGRANIDTIISSGTNLRQRRNGVLKATSALQAAGTLTGGWLGRSPWSSASIGPCHILAQVTVAGVLTDAEIDQVEAALTAIFSVKSPSVGLLIEGDSIHNGVLNYTYGRTLGHKIVQGLSVPVYAPDLAVAGHTTSQVYGRRVAAAGRISGFAKKIAALNLGTNDIQNATSGAIVGVATDRWTNYILPLIQYYQSQGISVVINTIIARAWTGSAQDILDKEGEWNVLNGLIRSNASTYNYRVADVAALSQFDATADASNTTYYGDTTHPKEAGAALMAAVEIAQIEAAIAA